DGFFLEHDFVQGDELLGADEGAGAVVDEDVAGVGREGGEGDGDGVLTGLAAAHEEGRGGRVGGEFHQLFLVAIDDDEVVGDAAGEEGAGGVVEDGASAEGGEDLVGTGALHALAVSGGEEDGGGAAHVKGG